MITIEHNFYHAKLLLMMSFSKLTFHELVSFKLCLKIYPCKRHQAKISDHRLSIQWDAGRSV